MFTSLRVSAGRWAEYGDACASVASPSRRAHNPSYGRVMVSKLVRYTQILASHAANATGGQPLIQMRVDFFVSEGHIYFAELSFFHQVRGALPRIFGLSFCCCCCCLFPPSTKRRRATSPSGFRERSTLPLAIWCSPPKATSPPAVSPR